MHNIDSCTCFCLKMETDPTPKYYLSFLFKWLAVLKEKLFSGHIQWNLFSRKKASCTQLCQRERGDDLQR
jgi:hypothetical protein